MRWYWPQIIAGLLVLSGAPAIPIAGAEESPLSGSLAPFSRSTPKSDEVFATPDPSYGAVFLDINDRFAIRKMPPTKLGHRIEFVVLDGERTLYSDCRHPPRPGDPQETSVAFEWGEFDPDGSVEMAVSRSLNYEGHQAVYRFKFSANRLAMTLDYGITATLRNTVLSYVQTVGPIGPRGRDTLEISFDLDREKGLNGIIGIDSETWTFSIAKDGSRTDVNGVDARQNLPGINLTASPIQRESAYAPGSAARGTLVSAIPSESVHADFSGPPIGACPSITCYDDNSCPNAIWEADDGGLLLICRCNRSILNSCQWSRF